jgi:magnesium transporter
MSAAAAAFDARPLHVRFLALYPGEATRILEDLTPRQAADLLGALPLRSTMAVWERLSPPAAAGMLKELRRESALEMLAGIDPNRAAVMLAGMEESERRELLAALPPQVATDLERAMSYPPDRAGALMDTQIAYYSRSMTVRQAIARLRAQRRRGFRVIFVVDDGNVLQGMVDMQDLALAEPNVVLKELMRTVPVFVESMETREEVVSRFEQFRVTELPVVDFAGRLLGVIRHHVLVEAAMAETSADIQTMVGVSKDERALSSPGFAVRKRLPWLHVNLVTAFLAASVVGLFESTIAQFTALAILMPVVAGEAGNTGQQALAVTMRGLALREIHVGHWRRVVLKEVLTCFLNGVAVALTCSVAVFLWSQSAGLALIIGLAMISSMTIAGLAGSATPIILTALGQDPAQSSSIFLTTMTDVMGFFSFLGIATLLHSLL